MNKKKLILIFGFYFFIVIQAFPQMPFFREQISSDYNRGRWLFEKEKFPAAIRFLDKFTKNNNRASELLTDDAEFLSAVASINVFNSDAEYRMNLFIRNHPESPKVNEARLLLGNYFYQNKNYRKASDYYTTVNRQELESDILTEYFFRYGYSLYMKGDKSKALLVFSEIKDIDTEYTPPAVYYFSQIAYEQKMYKTALEGFMRLKDDETFGSVVPFYIVQILYIQKDYDGILSIAPDLLKSAGKERSVELFRFIGNAYYNKGNYKEAVQYLEKYSEGAKASGREDKYQLGYCYYKTGETDKAVKILLQIKSENDLISQNIWNILGSCYLDKGDKKRARMAFSEASKMNNDRKIKEESLLNYAKLTYETSYSPFGEAIAAFQEYIDLYPGSDRIQEVYDYLVGAYTQLKNYKSALASLDKIPNKDARLEEAYQKIAFFRGLELFKNNETDAAIDMFDNSLKYEKYNLLLRARTIYWRGEAWYRLSEYSKAKTDFETFMGIPGASSADEYKLVRYDLAYSLFNLKDYNNALIHLKSFETDASDVKAELITDTWDRIADCYYISTNYSMAIAYYDKVIDNGTIDVDYAMFQKAFSLGLLNNNRSKVDVLTALIERFPNSAYVPNAIFERGRAFLVMENFDKGETDFNKVISTYTSSPFVPRSIVQLGLLYYNLGQYEKAIAQFKKVIEEYKSTPEARYAVTGLRNAYVDMNNVETYFAYIKTVDGYGNVDLSQKDSLLYASGENLYMSGKFDAASGGLKNYLNEFPNGSFSINAEYYLAESLHSLDKDDEALTYYIEVSDKPNNQFVEKSLIAASGILFDKEEYEEAYKYYEKLENVAGNDANRVKARQGELKSAYQAGDAQKTIDVASRIINSENIPDELLSDATFMRAKANYSLNNFDEALKDFKILSREITTAEGAESKFRVAELLYKKDLPSESKNIISEFIDQNSPHQYWTARIFILLSDISAKEGDILQSRATLQSLKDNYPVDSDGILDEVNSKLAALDEKK
jgi:TolA-binding protein